MQAKRGPTCWKKRHWSWNESKRSSPSHLQRLQSQRAQQWSRQFATDRCCRFPSVSSSLLHWFLPVFPSQWGWSFHKLSLVCHSLGSRGHVLSGCSLQRRPLLGCSSRRLQKACSWRRCPLWDRRLGLSGLPLRSSHPSSWCQARHWSWRQKQTLLWFGWRRSD